MSRSGFARPTAPTTSSSTAWSPPSGSGRAAANGIVGEDALAAGRPLSGVCLPRGSHIVVDYHGNRVGGPETVLEPGERYVVAVEAVVIGEVMNLLRG